MLIIFFYGAIIGSFLNVCIYRIPRGESVINPASHCPSCNTPLKWIELIPIISYIILQGKCSHCKIGISIKYPIIEAITAILFLLLYLKFGFTYKMFKYVVLLCYMIVISIIDLFSTDIYSITTYSGICIGLIFLAINLYLALPVLTYILAVLFAAVMMLIITLTTRAMGWGDMDICILIGLFIGLKLTILTMVLSFIFGGFISVFMIIIKRKAMRDPIPFGPFIALAMLVAIFLGEPILHWYLTLYI